MINLDNVSVIEVGLVQNVMFLTVLKSVKMVGDPTFGDVMINNVVCMYSGMYILCLAISAKPIERGPI